MSAPGPLAVVEPIGRGQTLTASATEAIRQAVADRRLVPGRLYSVAELAGLLGVSRTPVREALLILEHDRVVAFARNRGVRILVAGEQEIREVFELRELLEVPATRTAAKCLERTALAKLQRACELMASCAEAGDEAAFMAHDQAFHEVILAAAGNSRVLETVARLRSGIRLAGVSTAGRSRELGDILAEHRHILAALEQGDPRAAAAAMRAHLRHTSSLLQAQA